MGYLCPKILAVLHRISLSPVTTLAGGKNTYIFRRKDMLKKFLVWALTLCMIVSSVPISALAMTFEDLQGWKKNGNNNADKIVDVEVIQSCPTLWPCGLCSPWNSPSQNTGMGSLSLLQGIFPTQGLNPDVPVLQADSLPAEPQGKPVTNS